MKNPELFHKTVGILVNAYLNDTLVHGRCSACAVGNIIAASLNVKIGNNAWLGEDSPAWGRVFMTCTDTNKQRFNDFEYCGEAKRQIDSTGYSCYELAMMEFAFETAKGKPNRVPLMGSKDPEWMYNGLMAVVDTLAEIHEMDLTATAQAKSLFVQP